jgi:hypothetical protein
MAKPEELDLLVVDSGLPSDVVDTYRRAGVAIQQARTSRPNS